MSDDLPEARRQDHEPPAAIGRWGWRYHHLGIPTTIPQPGERYYRHLKMHVAGFDASPYGIGWMRFDPDCPLDALVRTVPTSPSRSTTSMPPLRERESSARRIRRRAARASP